MKKKKKNLFITIGVLAAFLLVYFVIVALDKQSATEEETDTVTASDYWTESVDLATVTVDNGNDSFGFNYEDSDWNYQSDSDFDVDQTVITSLTSSLTSLQYYRQISDYDSLSDFGLDEPVVTITALTDDGVQVSLEFTSVTLNDGMTYFKEAGSDIVYTTDSTLYNYASYGLYDFYDMTDVPDISAYTLKQVNFDISGGENITVLTQDYLDSLLNPDEAADSEATSDSDAGDLDEADSDGEDLTEASEADTDSDSEDDDTSEDDDASDDPYMYYVNSNGETIDDAKIADLDNSSVLYNYITEFCFNNAVNYKPTEEDIAEYGLDNPQATITIIFSGLTSVIDVDGTYDTVDSDYYYTLNIGYPVTDEKNEYYVSVSCTESENSDTSIYDTRCIYTMGSVYVKYFLAFDESRINGVHSAEQAILEDDTIPELSVDNINSMTVTTVDGDEIEIVNDEGSWTYSVNDSEDLAASDTFLMQLSQYLTDSGKFVYGDSILKYTESSELDNYGLLTGYMSITFNYNTTDSSESEVVNEWTLYIGDEDLSYYGDISSDDLLDEDYEADTEYYYVTASNTSNIYLMNSTIAEYFLSIDEELLNGTKTYKTSEVEMPIN
jgi:hypothetical protein